MPADHFSRFFPVICAGFGLLLAGGVNLLLIRRGFAIRTIATLVAALIAISAATASDIGLSGMTKVTARMLLLGLIPFLVLGSRRFIAGTNAVVSLVHRPVVRFSLLAFVGVATIVGSIMAYAQDDEVIVGDAPSELEMLRGHVKTLPTKRGNATTDLGTRLILREPVGTNGKEDLDLTNVEDRILQKANLDEEVIRRGAADDHSNCHGWVFTGGRFLLFSADVELILRENGYQEQHDPKPGDLVVYREESAIMHTGIVRYVTEGQPVLVESKWGELGVFLHAVDKSVYGSDYKFYRSARKGHLLADVPLTNSPLQESP